MICLRKMHITHGTGRFKREKPYSTGVAKTWRPRGKVPLLKHRQLSGGLEQHGGKLDSQRDQQAKRAPQQGRTEVLEGEPERDSINGQSVERTSSRVVGRGRAGSNEARHNDTSEKQGDRHPAKELQDRKSSLDLLYFRIASHVCLVVRLLRLIEHKCSFLIADISVHWFSLPLLFSCYPINSGGRHSILTAPPPGVFPPYRQKPSSVYSQIVLPLTFVFLSENANKNELPAVTGSEQSLSGKSSNVLDSQDHARFEQLVLPHLDAAYNLARWLLSISAWGEEQFNLATGGEVHYAGGIWVSGEFFEVLGVRPHLGRVISVSDDRRGCGAGGVVISYAFWQRNFGCDYRRFRPYLNQHRRCTLESKDCSLCLAQSSSASRGTKCVSRKNPVLDHTKFGRVN
jgi:hypothetical protein